LQYENRPLQEAGGKRAMMAMKMAIRMAVMKKRMMFDDDGSKEHGSERCENENRECVGIRQM
jgi:hypothetical protein